MLSVVLIHPEIPPNTGNIGRLCVATGATLHLVKPLGFRIDDRSLRRAGLDYWKHVDLVIWDSLDRYLSSVHARRVVLTSARRGRPYHLVMFREDDHLLFGPETTGLPQELFEKCPDRVCRIPIRCDGVRSLNLSTAAGIVLYEALRQTGTMPNIGEHCEGSYEQE